MQLSSRLTCQQWLQRPLCTTSSMVFHCFGKGCADFLPWLRKKAGTQISTALSIGTSEYGRSLIARDTIEAGDCILRVPYNVQLVPDDLPPEINSLLGDELGDAAKLALVILVKQRLGEDSEWAPYITRLPQIREMHNTIFWREEELDMIDCSSAYQETVRQRALLHKNFLTVKPALYCFPEVFGDVTLMDFAHAHALVGSRAWWRSNRLSLIPFADFLNHDGNADAVVMCDECSHYSEVLADRSYAPGEQVFIRYGKFSNATLLVDFGFTIPQNKFDQVQIQIDIPENDVLRELKLDLLRRYPTPTIKNVDVNNSSANSFSITEVKSMEGKGRGIPQSLRAFARVLCSTSTEELYDLAMEAEQTDGRLARHPLKNRSREIRAHQILLCQISQLTKGYLASIESLEHISSPSTCKIHALRKKSARDLLCGELRVLNSAAAWLNNYCATLLISS